MSDIAKKEISDASLRNFVKICEQIASGEYEKAKAVFDLSVMSPDGQAHILIEAFAMMLIRVEAREFELERMVKEIAAAKAELKRHQELLTIENKRLKAQTRKQGSRPHVVGQTGRMLDLLRQAERCALTQTNVLITGETGTGKSVLAKYIHDLSPRADKPFMAINCAAIPSSLLESELFGIESGVASGVSARIGRFEQASGGTILLDEIGDMPMDSQVKILDIIESGMLERVGGRKRIPVDVRIMAATHRDLAARIKKNEFRADLYYRLNVMHLCVPPLRERVQDIPLLVNKVLGELALRPGYMAQKASPEAMSLLVKYDWPGNIRELQNVLERAMLLAEGVKIMPKDLPAHIAGKEADAIETDHGRDNGQGEARIVPENGRDLPDAPDAPGADEVPEKLAADSPLDAAFAEAGVNDIGTLEQAEAAHIIKALRLTGGNKSHAARMLGISREGLRVKLSRLQLA